MITLSPDQNAAFGGIALWMAAAQTQVCSLAGLAGTGKSTILKNVLAHAGERGIPTAVASFTGKAVSVLHGKGIQTAQTLHSLLYQPIGGPSEMWLEARKDWKEWSSRAFAENPQEFHTDLQLENAVDSGRFGEVQAWNVWKGVRADYDENKDGRPKWEPVPEIDEELVIVDEASMVNNQLHEDLQRVAKQILYVGDHGQLEPIGANPQLMLRPDFRLEKIHRQAGDSAIIPYAHHLRNNGYPLRWNSGPEVLVTNDPGAAIGHEVVICGFNNTRVRLNHFMRQRAGFTSEMPMPGEPVICLRNRSKDGLFNGHICKLMEARPNKDTSLIDLTVENSSGDIVIVSALRSQFGSAKPAQFVPRGVALFDWAYALTAHKSQGSQFQSVAVYEELSSSWNPSRWRYTAATRAVERLTYILPA
jgi:exodeoxyribonuclease-5